MREHKAPDVFNDSDWEHLLSSSTPPPPPTTSYSADDPFLSVFPPINHEGLPVGPSLGDSHHQQSTAAVTTTANITSAATATSSSSSAPAPSPSSTDPQAGDPSRHQRLLHSHSPSPVSLVGGWADFALQMVVSKVISAVSSVRSRVVVLLFPFASSVSGGGVMASAVLMVLGAWIWWSRKRRRRRRLLGSVGDTTHRLNLLIREKDEKIMELLNQVAELNKLLLARYRVPVVREC